MPRDAKQPISGPLRQAIAKSGMSFQALERETGVLRQSLMKFVRGEQALRGDAYDRLASFFGKVLTNHNWENPTMVKTDTPRQAFWRSIINDPQFRGIFQSSQQPQDQNWCGFPSGKGWARYGAVFQGDGQVRVDVCLNVSGNKAETKRLFDALYRDKARLETQFGDPLTWDRLPNGAESRIFVSREGKLEDDQSNLEEIKSWIIETLIRLKKTFGPTLRSLN